ncbi:translocation/assembly module TamB domain-containing protein [Psychroflexus aestuariivivens]|uniref:translocation/assembly module TamB domain-containing protein n=1 Tax=Psychroflexus aestuariivivens TaxID=1795040 RepID=UPI000FDA636C|nr:translocation/assembly module TamB [Psychroflexus aestuariivivens]
MKNTKKQNKHWAKRLVRIIGKTLLILFILFILLVLFIRSPWGQDIIVTRVTNYVTEKTNTKFEIEKLYITFSGDISLEELYLEDQQNDTLVYSKYLEADIPFYPIIKGEGYSLDALEWRGLKANISREKNKSDFNYQFLVDAFAGENQADTSKTKNREPMNISVGNIHFHEFDLNFDDEKKGMSAHLNLGDFTLEGKSLDLEQMRFHISEIALKNTDLKYYQTQQLEDEKESETSKLPWLIVDDFSFENIKLDYQSQPENLQFFGDLAEFELVNLNVDLNQQDISLDKLLFNDSSLSLQMQSPEQESEEKAQNTKSDTFSWPEWAVNVSEISINRNAICVLQNGENSQFGKFNPQAIDLSDFTFQGENFEVSKSESLSAELNKFQFIEASGFELKKFAFVANLNSDNFQLQNLNLATNRSEINGNLNLSYNSLQDLINHPKSTDFSLGFSNFNLDANEIFLFSPDLKSNTYLKVIAKNKINGNLNIDGRLADFNVEKFNLNWGKNTNFNTKGRISKITSPDSLQLNLKSYSFKSNRVDIQKFVNAEDLGIQIPKSININGQLNGGLQALSTKTKLQIPEGKIDLNGEFSNKNKIAYKADLEIDDLELGQLLENPSLGKLNMKLQSSGEGKDLNSLDAKLTSQIDSLDYENYSFKGLVINGDLKNGKGDVKLDYKDKHLDLALNSKITLDSVSPKFEIDLDLKGARLSALGLTDKDIRTKLNLKAMFEGNSETFHFESQMKDAVAVYNDQTYYIGDLSTVADIDENESTMSISSNFLNANFDANANLNAISKAIQKHLAHYYKESSNQEKTEENSKSVVFNLKADFYETPVISEVFADGIQKMDTLHTKISFDESKANLSAEMNLPFLNYQDNKVENLNFILSSDESTLDFNFGFDQVEAGPLQIAKTNFEGHFADNTLALDFNAFKDEKQFFHIMTTLSKTEDGNYSFHVQPKDLYLNGKLWQIPENNAIEYIRNDGDESIQASDFDLTRNDQFIKIRDNFDVKSQHIGLEFQHFSLSTLTNYLNPEQRIARGEMNGNFIIVEPLKTLGILANLEVKDLSITEVALGNLKMEAEALNQETYDFQMSLKDKGVDFDLVGDYFTTVEDSKLDLDFNLNKLELATVQQFSEEFIKDAEGYLEGSVKIEGPLDDIKYDGILTFNQAGFNLKPLNTKFNFKNESITLKNEEIAFSNFQIQDQKGNIFKIDGDISTESMINPKFNLDFKADKFQLLNSTAKDNDLYYGKLQFDADAKLRGDLNFPVLDLDLTINENTNLTYLVPESQASIEEREGVVVFVNKKNPENILTKTDEEKLDAMITGIELNSNIKIQPKTEVNVVINKRTGDNLKIKGGGDFQFKINRNAKMNLVGKYEVNDGHFELNLYNIVKRKFDIAKSSSVTWTGDPMNANLDIRAIYNIETSASSLMAAQTTGENVAVKNKYRQKLPFMVYLNVDGEIDSPKLTFKLDMPEANQGAINGSVYGRITQLNQQEEQLNKQVFSLLVLNKFYPESGTDGSQGGPASIARENLNQAISDQLNTFSEKLTGNTGVQLSFDVNSYTDYQGETVQERTDVDINAQKKLFDDRLIVQAGSQVNVQGEQRPGENTAVVGNVSLEYLITENGRWRLKGFRKSEYENVIDGQVFVSGIALIFRREFNKFRVLWDKSYRESLQNETSEDKEKSDKDSDKDSEENTDKDNKSKQENDDK